MQNEEFYKCTWVEEGGLSLADPLSAEHQTLFHSNQISLSLSNSKGIDFKIQTVDIEGIKIKLQIWLVLFVLYSNFILLTGTQLVQSDSEQSLQLIIEE